MVAEAGAKLALGLVSLMMYYTTVETHSGGYTDSRQTEGIPKALDDYYSFVLALAIHFWRLAVFPPALDKVCMEPLGVPSLILKFDRM